MSYYEVEMQHSEETFTALSRIQYDLFCVKNRITRSLISLVCIVTGVLHPEQWWSLLIIAYGCYLTTSIYLSPNHTAKKLAAQIRNSGCPFPYSRYLFEENEMRVISLPDRQELDPIAYSDICRIGEDFKYFYLFRDHFGGYIIPKDELGEKENSFRQFITEKSGQTIKSRKPPIFTLIEKLSKKS